MLAINFETFDNLLNEIPREVNKIIFNYYYDLGCKDCKIHCDTCEFCKLHREGDYFCKCCCICSVCHNDNWEMYYESHYKVKLDPSTSPSPPPPPMRSSSPPPLPPLFLDD